MCLWIRGLSAGRHALLLWGLEEVDPPAGRSALHPAAHRRPAVLHLGTAEIRGEEIFSGV